MKILVTGGAGFIGKHLCHKLLTQRHTVVAVDNFITSHKKDLRTLLVHSKFKFVRHDIVKPLPAVVSKIKFNQIYHLACPTGVPNVTRLGEEMLLTSSIGTKNVLDFARRIDAPFVFTSSSEVYGNPLKSPQPEEYTGNVDPTGIRSTYEEGKRFAESLVVWYARRYNLRGRIVRLFNTYGPGMSDSDTRVIPTFMRQATRGQALTVQGSGNQQRTFCYVMDTVNAIILAMEKGATGRVYNIGSTQLITMNELAHLIKKITHSKSSITYIVRPAHDHDHRRPVLTKIKRLGWKPTTTLSNGLRLTTQSIV